MTLTRRQFVQTSAAGLVVPTHLAAALAQQQAPPDRELVGKTICGYQGWFNARGDGMDLSFRHYQTGRGLFHPGHCTIDLWPDVSDLDEANRYDTAFEHRDGSTAQVFSSADAATVDTHFQWMAEHGIDGVALQRFGHSLRHDNLRRMRDRVLANVRAAAAQHGRLWMNMYDLSSMREGEPQQVIGADWRRLVEEEQITDDATYLQHEGRPIVTLWGVGFDDDRRYTLDDCARLIEQVSMDGRFAVMLGVPYYWREQGRDTVDDPALHEVLAMADILSPWAVGRFGTPDRALRLGREHVALDIDWCAERGKLLLPVAFPGFSWHNLKHSLGIEAQLGHIPRLGGRFLWAQAEAARLAGAQSLYVAMFDEIDEATAIFKCTNNPPVGESPFLDYEDLPSDHYLWLTGQITQQLRRGAEPAFEEMPQRG